MAQERKKRPKRYTIGVVANTFGIHEQTLRLYEREGLLTPSRSEKNTRYYTDDDLEKLKMILSLTRDMGVNLAGVQIIIDLRQRMDEMQRDFNRFLEYLREQIAENMAVDQEHLQNALVRTPPSHLVIIEQTERRTLRGGTLAKTARQIKIEAADNPITIDLDQNQS